ncbi:hypothetical protein GCM10009007_03350 [Formosimonas limnophila]|uniref:DUF2213 domain-containing protein n=1 Tax=Formosimonas limnophila TaxID=1384487 RepID=A0A8J3CJR0_9BURK|nr:DUF2213 domain-containing protein [Formosimonas limnophila]GHA66219.1 hypothetical protein GCM10009007_03350 [Formosimonas limnophila]
MNKKLVSKISLGNKKQDARYKGQEKLDLNNIERTSDGAVILNGYPFRSGIYEYYDWEVGDGFSDRIMNGFISDEEAKRLADLMVGLPLTFDHVFIDTLSHREEHGIGSVISNGEYQDDGRVKCKVLITNGDAIAKFSTQEFNQLSIGFTADIDKENAPDGADFLIKNIRLNHVALVEFGRAGAGGSLANSKVVIKEDVNMDIKELQATVAQLTLENTELKNSKTELEKLRAENDMLKKAQKSEDEIRKEAEKLANSWSDLSEKIVEMTGEKSSVPLTNSTAAMKAALQKIGHSMPDDATDVYVQAAFDFALQNGKKHAKPIDAQLSVGGSFEENVEKTFGGQ